jgi:hypothetical protein
MTGARIAAIVVLAVDVAAATAFLLLFVLVIGVWSWLRHAPQDLALAAAIAWVAIAAGAVALIWMIWSGRRFWSRGGTAANVLWTVFMLALGTVGYPLLSPYSVVGLIASALLLVVAIQERKRPPS